MTSSKYKSSNFVDVKIEEEEDNNLPSVVITDEQSEQQNEHREYRENPSIDYGNKANQDNHQKYRQFNHQDNIKSNKLNKSTLPGASHYHYGHRRSLSFGSKPIYARASIVPPIRRNGSLRQPFAPQRRLSVVTSVVALVEKNPGQNPGDKSVSFSSNQIWTLAVLSLASFTSMLAMSILAPFFPLEASNKGMRETVYGLVFSMYALVIMIVSPLSGILIPIIGPKFTLLAGIFVAGVSNILFGLLDQIDDLQTFTAFCFIVRIFKALGAAAFSTASYTIIMQIFPDNIGTAFVS
jgi:hypothetical protein